MDIQVIEIPVDPKSSKNERISKDRTYITRIHGRWYMGKFNEQWYGWSFYPWGSAGIQLNHIEKVYECDTSQLEDRDAQNATA